VHLSVEDSPQTLEPTITGPRSRSSSLCNLLLAIYVLLLLLGAGYVAAKRTLWWDEIITHYVATLPTFHEVWRALLLGADGQPPVFYLFVRSSVSLFGAHEFGLRFPSLVAYASTIVLIYVAVSRRTSPVYGLMASLLFSLTESLTYAYEARPYALVLLFSSCAFVAWQHVRDAKWRPYALFTVSLALSASISVHYNAVLGFAPFLIGELALAVRCRRLDWLSISAIVVAIWPVISLRPHMAALRAYTTDYWGSTTLGALQGLYLDLFGKLLFILLVALAIFFAFPRLKFAVKGSLNFANSSIPGHELAAAAGFALLPAVQLLAAFFTKAIHYRYVIETCVGTVIAVAFILSAMQLRRRTEILVVAFLGVEFLHTLSGKVRWPNQDGWGTVGSQSQLFSHWRELDNDLPLVVGVESYHVVLRYGAEQLKANCYYVITPSHANGHVAVIERAFRAVQPAFRNVTALELFEKSHRRFLVFSPDPWSINELFKQGAQIQVHSTLGDLPVYQVQLGLGIH
jgi:Dolichyl-phosphate-mannose-protein mannosyltransferase